MTLKNLVENFLAGQPVNYTPTNAIYIERSFSEKSEVRFGQLCFENGGVLDNKMFFCDNEEFVDETVTVTVQQNALGGLAVWMLYRAGKK